MKGKTAIGSGHNGILAKAADVANIIVNFLSAINMSPSSKAKWKLVEIVAASTPCILSVKLKSNGMMVAILIASTAVGCTGLEH